MAASIWQTWGEITPSKPKQVTAGVVNLASAGRRTCRRHTQAEIRTRSPSEEVVKCHMYRWNYLKGDGGVLLRSPPGSSAGHVITPSGLIQHQCAFLFFLRFLIRARSLVNIWLSTERRVADESAVRGSTASTEPGSYRRLHQALVHHQTSLSA